MEGGREGSMTTIIVAQESVTDRVFSLKGFCGMEKGIDNTHETFLGKDLEGRVSFFS